MSMGSSGTCTIQIERYVVFTAMKSRWLSNNRWCLTQNCNLGLWQSQRRAVWKAFRGIFTQGTNLQSQYKTFSNLSFLHFFRTLSLVRFGDILTEMIAKIFSGHWQWWYSEVQSSTTPSTPPIMCTHMHHIGRPASPGGDSIRLIIRWCQTWEENIGLIISWYFQPCSMITTPQMDASSWPRHLLGMDQGSLANDQATGDSLPYGDLSCFLCIRNTKQNMM